MGKRSWLVILGAVGVLTLTLVLAPVLAHGPTNPQSPGSPGDDSWEEMYQECHGAEGTTGGGMMGGSTMGEGMMGGGMMGGGTMGGGMMGGGTMGLTNTVTLGRVAGTLQLTSEELVARLAQGETIAQIAQAKGVDTTLIVNTILAPQGEMLQVQVRYGYLSETTAQAILEQARLWAERLITTPLYSPTTTSPTPTTGNAPGHGSGGMMGGGMMGGGMMGGGMMGWR